jgi:hypothetical protein
VRNRSAEHIFKTSPDGRWTAVFDATGAFVTVMPVMAGGDGNDPPPADPPPADPALKDLPEDVRNELAELRKFKEKSEPELKRARDDAAKYRTEAQTRARAAAVKALKDAGLAVPKDLEDDPNDTGITAATAAAVAEKEKLTTDLRDRDIRDKVRDEAEEQGANYRVLLGYLIGEKKLSNLDPTAEDFGAKVKTLVQDTIKAEPSFKKGQAPGKSGSDLGAGGSGDDKPKSLEDAVSSHYAKT